MIEYTTKQLAEILRISQIQAYRLAKTLKFEHKRRHNKLIYFFSPNHPFILSIELMETNTKPIYTISEISKLWTWRNGSYSTEWVRKLLKRLNVTVYNQSNKGWIFLCDLAKIIA